MNKSEEKYRFCRNDDCHDDISTLSTTDYFCLACQEELGIIECPYCHNKSAWWTSENETHCVLCDDDSL